MGKKYEYVINDRKRILMVHNVTEEDVGIYDCVLPDDKMSMQLTLKGMCKNCSYLHIICCFKSQLGFSREDFCIMN